MVKSMTGFGRCEVITEEYRLSVEMKAVNHRYLDLSIKMPRKLNFLEAPIRALLKEYMERGKVDVFITYEDYAENRVTLKYNHTLAEEYMSYFRRMSEEFGIVNDISVSRLASMPEIFSIFASTFISSPKSLTVSAPSSKTLPRLPMA